MYIPVEEGVVALARETGEPRWTTKIATERPLVLGPDVVIALTNDTVIALDRANGETSWRSTLPSNPIGPGIIAGDRLVVPLENEAILALRVSDGMVAWEYRLTGLIGPVLLTADAAAAYLTAGDSQVAAIDLDAGRLRWRRSLRGMLSAPAVAKARVFIGSTSNAFYALDAQTGRDAWHWGGDMIGGDVIGAAVDDDVTYFASLDNLLRAVNRGNGNQRWKQPTPTRPIAPPLAFGGMVAVFGLSPAIATFNARTGAAIATYAIPTASGATTAPAPKGPPLIDPEMRPFRVAFVVVTADGRAIGLRPTGLMFREAATAPLAELPGKALQRERSPLAPAKPSSPGP